MNCEQCKEQISAYLDNELDQTSSANVRTHLAVCGECARVCEDFAMILDFCIEESPEESVSPNSNALWCRINNVIETEIKPAVEPKMQQEEIKLGFFSKLRHNHLQLSFSQTLTAVLGVALISSLLTVVGLGNFSRPNPELTTSTSVSDTIFEKILGKFGLIETPQQARAQRLEEQQRAIDYWNKKVELRRESWNANLRDTFDRNLNEINQVVSEYNSILEENPHDSLTGEMLDSAMRDKMEFLREFSEL